MKTKAGVLYEYGSGLTVDELEVEAPKEGEVLVKFKAAGLCHSDYSVINGIIQLPIPAVPGHEGAGVVQEVGPGVTRVKPGDHVVLLWAPVCGKCYYCRRGESVLCVLKDTTRTGTMLDGTYRLKKGDQNIGKMIGVGSFSQYNVINEESLLAIDKDIPFDVAAITGCAVMTGVGAVLNKAKVQRGSSVCVVGIGGVGLNVVQGAVLSNASKIIAIDVLDNKLEFAKQFGATHVINAAKEDPVQKVMEITNGIGSDYAFEALGKVETAMTTFNLIRRGGYAVLIGIPAMADEITFTLNQFPLMDKSILGSYYGSGDMTTDLITFFDLYRNGRLKLDELITNRYSLDEINQGFDDLEAGKNARGVVIYE